MAPSASREDEHERDDDVDERPAVAQRLSDVGSDQPPFL